MMLDDELIATWMEVDAAILDARLGCLARTSSVWPDRIRPSAETEAAMNRHGWFWVSEGEFPDREAGASGHATARYVETGGVSSPSVAVGDRVSFPFGKGEVFEVLLVHGDWVVGVGEDGIPTTLSLGAVERQA